MKSRYHTVEITAIRAYATARRRAPNVYEKYIKSPLDELR